MKNLIPLFLMTLATLASCQSNPHPEKTSKNQHKEKTQNIKDAFATVHNTPKKSIADKLENKIKTLKDGDSRKAIVAKFDGKGLTQNVSSLSSDNEV